MTGTGGMGLRSLVAVAALVVAALPAWADLDVRDRIGFGGRWIVGAPTPYTLTLSNSGPEAVVAQIKVSTGASFGLHDFEHVRIVRLDAGAIRDEVFLLDGPQPWRGAIRVSVDVDPTVPIRCGDEMADRGSLSFERPKGDYGEATGLEFPTHVVGTIGDARAVVASAIAAHHLAVRDTNRPTAASGMAAVDVPDGLLRFAPLALEGLETLVLCDPDARTCAEPAALEGVIDWVALGGTLVVSLGEHAAEFAASPLAAQLPARWTGAQRRDVREALAELGTPSAGVQGPAPWTELRRASDADVTSFGDGPRGPCRIERRIGMGRVVVLAYDVRAALAQLGDQAPIGAAAFARVLAADVPPEVKEAQSPDGASFAGMTTTFGSALQHGAFAPPPLPLVIFGIIVYVVVVGPLDWFVLKRLRKERLTTLTFLGAVLAFTTLAFGASVLLFSAGSRVNRIVIADLADAGGGRQIHRMIDIAGFYSPRGADQPLAYAAPAVLLGGSFPGLGFGGDVGSALPVTVAPGDPLHPAAIVQLPFRSQRVVRAHSVGTLGPTIEVEWDDKGPRRRVRVTNGLPVNLDDVLVYVDATHAFDLGPVASGAKSKDGEFFDVCEYRARPPVYGEGWGGPGLWGGNKDVSRDEMRRLLEAVTIGSFTKEASGTAPNPNRDESAVLHRLGLARDGAFARGHALVVAFASAAPVPLPGSGIEGDTHVVIRKEVPIR